MPWKTIRFDPLVAALAVILTVRAALAESFPPNLALQATPAAQTAAAAPHAKYGINSLVDGDDSTHWASSARYKLPHWVKLQWDQPVSLDTVVIDIFARPVAHLYAHWKAAEVELDGGVKASMRFDPDESQRAILRFDQPVETASLTLRILEVYDPKTYVGIREIRAFLDPRRRIQPPAEHDRPQPREQVEIRADARTAVYASQAAQDRARRNAETTGWGKAEKAAILKEAAKWLEHDEAYWLDMLPEPGACYAYGFTGCPICGSSFGSWAGARSRWDRPRTVMCAKGHVLPDDDHPDDGTGYVAPDGRNHYLIGTWNAWVTEQWTLRALPALAHAYALTGDDQYARRAAFFFDALAAIYPESTAGSWDYPSRPPSGRFARPWYQVARNLVVYVEAYDLIQGSKVFDEPSLRPQLEAGFPRGPTAQQRAVRTADARGHSHGGMTRRENVEVNLLQDAAYYCYAHSFSGMLHNGHADYMRGALAVGVLLGIPEYVYHAVESPYSIRAMLANNCDRDGRYYETALGYALHARQLYLTFVEPLANWRCEKYPQGVNLFVDPRMQSLYCLPDAVMKLAGRTPNFGDCAPDPRHLSATAEPWSNHDVAFAERLYAAAPPAQRQQYAGLLQLVCRGDVEAARSRSSIRRWLLYHAEPVPEDVPAALDDDFRRRVFDSWFLGQKGIALLRDGQGADAQGVLVRYGPSLNHGHLDDLGLIYYGKGWQLTYEIGFGLGSTHAQAGWSRQTVSHALVTVNEASQRGGSGGSLHLFAGLPSVKLVEADSPLSYASQGVEQYRRTVALIGGGKDQYVVDLFRVRGGQQHDYGVGVQTQDFFTGGVELGPEEDGSLAGQEHAWGERIGVDGDIQGYPNRPYWSPPPGNGYGFFYAMRRGRPDGACFADWSLGGESQARFRLHLLPETETEVVLAKAPGLYPRLPSASYLLARRRGDALSSNFAAVMEPYAAASTGNQDSREAQPLLSLAERVPVEGGGPGMTPLGVHVRRLGRDEYLLSADLEDDVKTAQTVFGQVRWRGAALFLAGRDGQGDTLATIGAWDVSVGGTPAGPEHSVFRGTITDLSDDQRSIEIDLRLPPGDWTGAAVYFSNPRYSRNTAYRIYAVERTPRGTRIGLGPQSMILGQGRVQHLEENRIYSDVPHEYGKSVVGRNNPRFFDGKLIRSNRGAATRITTLDFASPMKLDVDSTEGFQVGDAFTYHDIQPGDRVTVVQVWEGTFGKTLAKENATAD